MVRPIRNSTKKIYHQAYFLNSEQGLLHEGTSLKCLKTIHPTPSSALYQMEPTKKERKYVMHRKFLKISMAMYYGITCISKIGAGDLMASQSSYDPSAYAGTHRVAIVLCSRQDTNNLSQG